MSLAAIHHTQWESLPVPLRPVERTCIQKVHQVAWNILSVVIPVIGLFRLAAYGIGLLAHRLILPAAYHKEIDKKILRDRFEYVCRNQSRSFAVTPHTIVTPDGAALSAHLFRSYNANETTPTVIYFGGNGALKGMDSGWRWVLEESDVRNIPINLVLFDYRSVDQSKGVFTGAKDLLTDGASIVNWVRTFLQTPDDQIHFYGMSLGGAIALKTKALDARLTGDLIHERSFSSLEDWLEMLKTRLKWFLKPVTSLAIWLLKNQDLEFDAASDWEKLRGRKLVLYHRDDPIIPYSASMARKVSDSFELCGEYSENHHCAPLSTYTGAREKVSGFIFRSE